MNTTAKYNVYPDISEMAAILSELRLHISAEDRIAAMKELNLGRTALSQYLNGKAKDLDIATALIKFFKKRIEKRRKAIA